MNVYNKRFLLFPLAYMHLDQAFTEKPERQSQPDKYVIELMYTT